MARRIFFSFHFANDFWRSQQVRNVYALEGQRFVTPNAWEKTKRKGDAVVMNWISHKDSGKSCVIVLLESDTPNRKLVLHKCSIGWNNRKGALGIRIHTLLNMDEKSSTASPNAYEEVPFKDSMKAISNILPPKILLGTNSKAANANISNNMIAWIEEAITPRERT